QAALGAGRTRQARWRARGLFPSRPGMPLFVLTAYAKNERADLSQQDRNDFRQLTTLLVETFKRRRRWARLPTASSEASRKPWPMPRARPTRALIASMCPSGST